MKYQISLYEKERSFEESPTLINRKFFSSEEIDSIELLRKSCSFFNIHLELLEDCQGIKDWREEVKNSYEIKEGMVFYYMDNYFVTLEKIEGSFEDMEKEDSLKELKRIKQILNNIEAFQVEEDLEIPFDFDQILIILACSKNLDVLNKTEDCILLDNIISKVTELKVF